jgi:hypothetical protein
MTSNQRHYGVAWRGTARLGLARLGKEPLMR